MTNQEKDTKLISQCKEHWMAMRDDPFGCAQRGEEPGVKTCALCQEYRVNEECGQCPIARYRGKAHCIGTPYYYAADAFMDFIDGGYGDDASVFRARMEAEIYFLDEVSAWVNAQPAKE